MKRGYAIPLAFLLILVIAILYYQTQKEEEKSEPQPSPVVSSVPSIELIKKPSPTCTPTVRPTTVPFFRESEEGATTRRNFEQTSAGTKEQTGGCNPCSEEQKNSIEQGNLVLITNNSMLDLDGNGIEEEIQFYGESSENPEHSEWGSNLNIEVNGVTIAVYDDFTDFQVYAGKLDGRNQEQILLILEGKYSIWVVAYEESGENCTLMSTILSNAALPVMGNLEVFEDYFTYLDAESREVRRAQVVRYYDTEETDRKSCTIGSFPAEVNSIKKEVRKAQNRIFLYDYHGDVKQYMMWEDDAYVVLGSSEDGWYYVESLECYRGAWLKPEDVEN